MIQFFFNLLIFCIQVFVNSKIISKSYCDMLNKFSAKIIKFVNVTKF